LAQFYLSREYLTNKAKVYNINMSLPIASLIIEADRCVACGLCLPHCPTYRKTGSEADSPRGRIQLMRAVATEVLPNNDRFKQHIDLCLGCRSCESSCPNNVNYGALLDATRAQFIAQKSIWFSLAKPFIRYRNLAALLLWPLWLIQRCKLDGLLKFLLPAAKILPSISQPSPWKSLYPAKADKQGAVSLFLGCASSAFDRQTLQASIYVLNQLGFDVHIPAQQTCCGSIARQMGDATETARLVKKNNAAFAAELPLLSVASGCGAGLIDSLPRHNIVDISAFLLNCDWGHTEIAGLAQPIYVQDPCTLRNVLNSQTAVYSLLKKIPHADIQPLPGNNQCCGGAGAYMLTQTSMATSLRDDKIAVIKANNVAILATSNIGCSLHIADGLREHNLKVTVLHPIQIIAQQMGLNPEPLA
jgi:glycolate oxidase iron-sulfur subunit